MAPSKKNAKGKRAPNYSSDVLALHWIGGLLLIALGALCFLALEAGMTGSVFAGLRAICYGLFGFTALALPVFPCWWGVLLILSTQRKVRCRALLLTTVLYLLITAVAELLTFTGTPASGLVDYMARNLSVVTWGDFLKQAYAWAYRTGMTMGRSGGLVGMALAWPLWRVGGTVPSAILCILLALVDAVFLFRVDVGALSTSLRQRMDAARAARAQRKQELEQQQLLWQQQQAAQQMPQPAPQPAPQPMPQPPAEPWQQYYSQAQAPAEGWAAPAANPQPAPQPVPHSTGRGRRVTPAKQPPQTTGTYGFPATEDETRPYEDGKRKPAAPGRFSRIFGGGAPEQDPIAVPSRQGSQPAPNAQPATTQTGRQRKAALYGRPQPAPAAPDVPEAALPEEEAPRFVPAAQVAAQTASQPPVTPAKPKPAAKPAPKPAPQPAPKAAPQQPRPSWTDEDQTPPWEDRPEPPQEVKVPVVTPGAPAAWHGDLDIVSTEGATYGERALAEAESVLDMPYVYPGLDLLKLPEAQQGINPEEDAVRARKLEETLASFKVQAAVRHITHGPAISRFELELAPGINVNRVTNLGPNIAMNMEVKSVRIEAPIPGKSLVGIEVPNRKVATVTMREVLESEPMRNAKEPLVVALGKDIAGTPIVCDLARMPHLLIAGQTGSGKSVCINTMINSLLYRCSPKEVRLILIDPKVVELQCYNGIPHLLIPVVSDPHKAAGALAWAVAEMMDRYKKFQNADVRNINGYNAQLTDEEQYMPRIVIIIDELADLMMTCKRDVEDHICRLAQLARAAGIHLVVATQRPSVDVITGLIKANIPSRIAFKVSSFVDSRTILDKNGAEQLLGWGDMLYQPTGEFTPIRVQGCFMSDAEVNRVTDFIRESCPSAYDPGIIEQLDSIEREGSGVPAPDTAEPEDDLTGDGSLLQQAIEMTVRDGQVSTSFIQRRLKIGYARAGRLVDEMEKRGIVSQKDGAKPRICLITMEQYEQMKQDNCF